MIKNLIILVAMIFMTKAYSQTKPAYLGGAGLGSDGIIEIANLQCEEDNCSASRQTFILPFSIEIDGNLDGVGIGNAEIYLTSIMKSKFNNKIKAMEYKGGIKFFGVQLEGLGAEFSSTNMLSINILSTEFVEVINLDDSGNKKIVFNLIGTFGASKLTDEYSRYSDNHIQQSQSLFGTSPEAENMNTDFGTKIDIGASITFAIERLEITGYARSMSHKSNHLISDRVDANGLVNKSFHNTFQTGLDLQYNIHTGKEGGQLFVFTIAQYERYNTTLVSQLRNMNTTSFQPIDKAINFQVGVRYTLPTFKKKRKKRKVTY